MYSKVYRLILSTAFLPADNRGPEEVREDILHRLSTLVRYKAPPFCEGLVEPAIRFVESSAWSLLWPRIAHEYGRKGYGMSREQLTDNDLALREHFQPIFEEISPMADEAPVPTPAPAHPILAQLIAEFGPVLAQFLLSFLSKLTPAAAAEMHAAACEAAAKSV